MKTEHLVVIILIAGAGSLVTYFVVSNWWNQTSQIIPHGISCSTELKEFQSNSNLSTRQQVESIIVADPVMKKMIDDSSYCEFMGLSTSYTENGTYQGLDINLKDTKELSVEVNLRNNSVVSYDMSNLTRNYPAP
jgi:capsular polysaccharide biosynthesis protein